MSRLAMNLGWVWAMTPAAGQPRRKKWRTGGGSFHSRATKMNWKTVNSLFCKSAYELPIIQKENPLNKALPICRATCREHAKRRLWCD